MAEPLCAAAHDVLTSRLALSAHPAENWDYAAGHGGIVPTQDNPRPAQAPVTSFPLRPISPAKGVLLSVEPKRTLSMASIRRNHCRTTEDTVTITVSTVFGYDARLPVRPPLSPPDLVLRSADEVYFYLHSHILLEASSNSFQGLISTTGSANYPVIRCDDKALLLTVVLASVYRLPSLPQAANVETLLSAIRVLQHYGFPPGRYVVAGTPLFERIVSFERDDPINVFATAAEFELDALASHVSQHLLSVDITSLPNETAVRIGPLYLKRLLSLHRRRVHTLKTLLLQPPSPHPFSVRCDFQMQESVNKAWALAAAALAWEARPDLSAATIQSTLLSLAQHLPCSLCNAAFTARVTHVVTQWLLTSKTL
ncbi:hypothetical protein K474DRAFT_1701051 [Panus rudis PR-1116 ss-1]|nr:hypothetical protein K474DRAFT_1701051 [Panus rudis PR-1116 ss-1]